MKFRKLKNEQTVAEAPVSIKMTIDSKCPKKWAFVDMETGDVWVHKSRFSSRANSPYNFYSADDKALNALHDVVVEKILQNME